jgi:hypothetical protein
VKTVKAVGNEASGGGGAAAAGSASKAASIPVTSAPVFSIAPLAAARPAFVDDLYSPDVCSVEYSQDGDIVFDPRFPLREYEFVELFVRCAVESQRLAALVSGDAEQQQSDAADIVYRALSDKVCVHAIRSCMFTYDKCVCISMYIFLCVCVYAVSLL